ncbi:MAG: type II secretion system protein [Phycisphaerales bacterium]|jgi:prepilin-type N-terminal cleavage/methylation domain-containing protein|nr:prepilin-type N-terminal cleavage/methylation domain-containing protein [Phycisphaeraceae bacterium]
MRRTITRQSAARGTRGAFTLIELLCAIVVLGVLGSVTSAIILRAGVAFAGAGVASQLALEGDSAMEAVARLIRTIPTRTGTSPAAPMITSVAADSITFGSATTIARVGTELRLTEGGQTRTLADDVSDFLIEPMSNAGAALSVPMSGAAVDAVQRVRVTLSLSRNGQSQTLRTTVFIRSLLAGAQP